LCLYTEQRQAIYTTDKPRLFFTGSRSKEGKTDRNSCSPLSPSSAHKGKKEFLIFLSNINLAHAMKLFILWRNFRPCSPTDAEAKTGFPSFHFFFFRENNQLENQFRKYISIFGCRKINKLKKSVEEDKNPM
jgi:hypothetical protein